MPAKIDKTFTHTEPARGYALYRGYFSTPKMFPYRTLGQAIQSARTLGTDKGSPWIIYGDWSYWRGPVAKVSYNGRVRYC